MSRRKGTPAWVYVAGAAVVAGAGAAALGLRRPTALRQAAGALPQRARDVLPERLRGDGQRGAPDQPQGESWRCECGQELLVAGWDRHRIYWLPEAGPGDPILSGHCPNCDRPLPSESGIAAS